MFSTEPDWRPPGSDLSTDLPDALRRLPDDRIVDVDVREDLRNGREPFARIMAARDELPEGGALRVRAIFEPVPLYGVMAKHGLDHQTEELAPQDWRVWFFDPAAVEGASELAEPAAPAAGSNAEREAASGSEGDQEGADELSDDLVVLDVRGLEPPEPLVRTLEALEVLPGGSTLLHINVREPVYLFPHLEQRGASWEVRVENGDLVRVFIRKPSS